MSRLLLICFCSLFVCLNANAENALFSFTGDSFKAKAIKVSQDGYEAVKLSVFQSQHKKSSVFSVPDPDRIVIDLLGATLKKNKDFTVKSSGLIKAVRFGAHSDKARIVIDLNPAKKSSYRTTESQGELTLLIESAGGSADNTPEEKSTKEKIIEQPKPTSIPKATATVKIKPTVTPSPTKEPTIGAKVIAEPEIEVPVFKEPTIKAGKATSKPLATEKMVEEKIVIDENPEDSTIEDLLAKKPLPTATPVSQKTRTPKPVPTVIPTDIPTEAIIVATETPTAAAEKSVSTVPAQTPLPQTQALKNIKFTYSQGVKLKPQIKVELVNKTQFELQKSDEKTYLLTIKDCREMKPELKLVNFPPHDFLGFTYIQAEENKTDINIKIGVERNKRIIAAPNENEIWISILEEEKPEAAPQLQKKLSPVEKSMAQPLQVH
jgi:hypothetical protein